MRGTLFLFGHEIEFVEEIFNRKGRRGIRKDREGRGQEEGDSSLFFLKIMKNDIAPTMITKSICDSWVRKA